MELWDIYDENKKRTGRTMKHNDWNMQPGEFHLTVLGVLMRPYGKYLITRRRLDKEWAAGWWEVPIKIPVVNAERCIGCGACENLCPSRPFSAIYVEGHVMHRTV